MILLNMDLIPMKAHFFLFNSGTAPIVPFLPTYAKQLGFSPLIVGLIYTFLPIMGMIAKPIMGVAADRFRCQKLLFQSCLLLTIISLFAILFVPAIPSESKVELHCNQESFLKICSLNNVNSSTSDPNKISYVMLNCNGNTTFLGSLCDTWGVKEYCSKLTSSEFVEDFNIEFKAKLIPYHASDLDCLFIKIASVQFDDKKWHIPYCNGKLLKSTCQMQYNSDALNQIANLSEVNLFSKYQFWILTTLLVLSWIGMAVVVSIGDAICFSLLGDFPNLYGNQRLWGAIGWGVFAILSGYLVDAFSHGKTNKDYTIVFYLMAFMLSLNLLVTFKIKYNANRFTSSISKDIGKLFLDCRIIVFCIWCILVGICTALIWNFLFIFLEELSKGSGSETKDWIKTLEGLIMAVQCFGGELPFFFLSGWILKKIGHLNAMSLVLFIFGIRFLLYSMLTDPWWCLPIELFQGFTYSILYATMASYASLVAPPGTENTVQGLVGAIFEGLGVSTGSFIGGILFSKMDGAMVFRICGSTAVLSSVLHALTHFFLKHNQQTNLLEDKGLVLQLWKYLS
uniref:Major facilitator superfamily associated domain-containing protein n=1 Tax=Clastoptera arizonana TaxID=38151 RepID=A0A1B6D4I8_9HEMI